jgi:hypothetical protein
MGGLAGIFGGGALSALGGILGAQSGNRAGRQARDYQASQVEPNRYGLSLALGGQGLYDFQGQNYQDFAARQRGGSFARDPTIDANFQRLISGQARGAGTGILGALNRLRAQTNSAQRQEMGRYDQQTGQIVDQYRQGGALARMFGAGRDNTIRADAERSLRSTNDLIQARLNASGLGASTVATDQLRANIGDNQRELQRALQGSSDSRLDREIGANNQVAGAMSGRDLGRVGLWESNLGRAIQLQQAPLNVALSTLQGNVMNPYLGQSATQYYPGYSGAGSAVGGLGNALALYSAAQGQAGGGGAGGTPSGQNQNSQASEALVRMLNNYFAGT